MNNSEYTLIFRLESWYGDLETFFSSAILSSAVFEYPNSQSKIVCSMFTIIRIVNANFTSKMILI